MIFLGTIKCVNSIHTEVFEYDTSSAKNVTCIKHFENVDKWQLIIDETTYKCTNKIFDRCAPILNIATRLNVFDHHDFRDSNPEQMSRKYDFLLLCFGDGLS